jgi:tetratricopeptide (TPR) repeat protein
MQDYMSSGLAPTFSHNFAPSASTNFAPNPYDLRVHMLAEQSALPKPASRREFIFQQERKIKNDFLRKTAPKSVLLLPTKSRTGTHSQHEKVNAVQGKSALHLKVIASAVAIGLILFTGQLGYSFVGQQLASHELHQPSPVHPDALTNFNNSIASAGSIATTPDGTTATPMSPNALDQAHQFDVKTADAQAGTVAATMEPKQAIQSVSVPTSDADHLILSKLSTVNLIKIGYERLRTGSAQESISILSEAVRRDRNDPMSRRYLGYALLQAGRSSEALGQYDALQKLGGLLPSDRLAMQHAMRTAQAKNEEQSKELGDNDSLISKYRAAILSNPKDFDSKYDLAVLYSKLGRTEEAIHECVTVTSELPPSSEKQQKFCRLYASLVPLSHNQT